MYLSLSLYIYIYIHIHAPFDLDNPVLQGGRHIFERHTSFKKLVAVAESKIITINIICVAVAVAVAGISSWTHILKKNGCQNK